MIRYLNSPYRTKYKYYHFRLIKKGQKGIYNIKDKDVSLKIKSKVAWILTPGQIEIIRRVYAKRIKMNQGNMGIISFPDLPKSKKPLGLRMGKGKGKFASWVAPIRYGQNIVRFCFSRMPIEKPLGGKRIRRKKKVKKKIYKIYKFRRKRRNYYRVIKETAKGIFHKLPVYTKINCRIKKPQKYVKIWKLMNKKPRKAEIKNDISRYILKGNR